MKRTLITASITLFFLSCAKEINKDPLQASSSSNLKQVTEVSIPLNDLGTGTYMGAVGGLYPGGANQPSGQYATDLLSTSNAIVPIDTFGNPSSTKGYVVFISLGASTGGHNMKMLKTKTDGNPATNPKLKLANCNTGNGDASLNGIMNPN